jgi:glycerol-3-phosphate cytidylyltransferase
LLKINGVNIMVNIIGYTTGVFDLFHVGHLNVLKRAKRMCNELIVGVTTDELVYERKNKYPVISFTERVEIVKAIRYVDEIVTQDSMDKMLAWEKLKFNIMFVGNDWKGTEKWNELEIRMNKVGVKIMYFPYTKTTSSSMIKATLEKFNNKWQ